MHKKDYFLFFLGFTIGGISGLCFGLIPQLTSSQTFSKQISKSHEQDPREEKISALKAELEKNPNDRKTLVNLGHLLFDTKQYSKAIPYYEKALSILPDDPDLLTDLGIAYRRVGNTEGAISSFRKASDVDHKHWKSLYNLGIVYKDDKKDNTKAREAFQQVIAINSKDPDILTDVATVYYSMEYYEDSLNLLLKALEISPKHWSCLYYLGFYYEDHEKDYSKAIFYYKEILKLLPPGHETHGIEKKIKALEELIKK